MKKFISLITALVLLLSASSIAATDSGKKVLMVVSSYGEDEGETKPGYEFDEFAKAYIVFKSNGVEIDIASPKGGVVVADKYNLSKEYNQIVTADKSVMQKLDQTIATQDIDASIYDGIFVVGGKGAMFDLPKDKNLQRIIASIYENKGSVSAVCHGPAALVDVKLSSGEYLVSGRKVNGFTNQEEKAFGKKWVKHFDFLLEDRLKERGAQFESSPMMLSHVAIDDRLVTGQNPFSTSQTAEQLLVSMGLIPNKSELFKEDRTIQLVAEILDGDNQAKTQFTDNVKHYQPELVAMYGYYSMMFSENKQQVSDSVMLMELASPFMQHPQLSLVLAQGYVKLDQNDKAKSLLEILLKSNPDMEAAKKMLDNLVAAN